MSCKFGWKRKAGERVNHKKSTAFEDNAKDEERNEVTEGEIDWLNLLPVKKKKVMVLEDAVSKSNRLKQEGTTLAQAERYWEAIKKWDAALSLTPEDETIHDMMSQAYTVLHEVYPAVRSAQKAVELKPTWWVGHQTLGRAHLNLGEVQMAIKSFSQAIHLNPSSQELWEEDLNWSLQLLQQKKDLHELEESAKNSCKATLTEITEETDGAVEPYRNHEKCGSELQTARRPDTNTVNSLPSDYVQMRDVIK